MPRCSISSARLIVLQSVVSMLTVLSGAALLLYQQAHNSWIVEDVVPLVDNRMKVVHLDEVLTMSARMAACSGDEFWVRRYWDHVPLLDDALNEVSKRLPHEIAAGSSEKTADANSRLIAMEEQVLDLAVTNRSREAQEIIQGDEYASTKVEYATGYFAVESFINQKAESLISEREERSRTVVIYVVVSILALLGTTVGNIRLDGRLKAENIRLQHSLNELEEKTARLDRERELSKKLVRNILPDDIAAQLLKILNSAGEDVREDGSSIGGGRRLSYLPPAPAKDLPRPGSSTSELSPSGRRTISIPRAIHPQPPSPAVSESNGSTAMQKSVSVAKHHEHASVLFADIVGFTSISSGCSASLLVGSLNRIISAVDRHCRRNKVEKIKTIGDCYMCCRWEDERHSGVSALPLLRLADAIHSNVAPNHTLAGKEVQFRVGVASGPLVSGVIGLMKFQFDIWGDTVNVASRMESTGVGGATQVTSEVRDALATTDMAFEARGEVVVKGKGSVRTFLHYPPMKSEEDFPKEVPDVDELVVTDLLHV